MSLTNSLDRMCRSRSFGLVIATPPRHNTTERGIATLGTKDGEEVVVEVEEPARASVITSNRSVVVTYNAASQLSPHEPKGGPVRSLHP